MDIIRYPDVAKKIGVNPFTIRRWATEEAYAAMGFPRPIPLGANSTGFIAQEIEDWLAGQAAKRDGGNDARPRRAARS